MSDINDKSALTLFINKRRKPTSLEIPRPTVVQEKLPWYKRPLERSEFMFRLAKNGRYYIKHKEWGKGIWIGPYTNVVDVEAIIASYLTESLKTTLDKKVNSNIHSVIINDEKEFF